MQAACAFKSTYVYLTASTDSNKIDNLYLRSERAYPSLNWGSIAGLIMIIVAAVCCVPFFPEMTYLI